jgi:hypothetical protein
MKAKLAEWGMLILLLVYIADSVNKIGHLIATRNWWLIASAITQNRPMSIT